MYECRPLCLRSIQQTICQIRAKRTIWQKINSNREPACQLWSHNRQKAMVDAGFPRQGGRGGCFKPKKKEKKVWAEIYPNSANGQVKKSRFLLKTVGPGNQKVSIRISLCKTDLACRPVQLIDTQYFRNYYCCSETAPQTTGAQPEASSKVSNACAPWERNH